MGPDTCRLGICGEVWVTGTEKGGAEAGRGCGLGWTGALYFCWSNSGALCSYYQQSKTMNESAEIKMEGKAIKLSK